MFVIDAKHYRGRPQLRVHGGLVQPRTQAMVVAGRDRTHLVTGVLRQAETVRTSLTAAGIPQNVPVHATLYWVDADWPLLDGTFRINGVEVLHPKKAMERIADPPTINTQTVDTIHRTLATQFLPA